MHQGNDRQGDPRICGQARQGVEPGGVREHGDPHHSGEHRSAGAV